MNSSKKHRYNRLAGPCQWSLCLLLSATLSGCTIVSLTREPAPQTGKSAQVEQEKKDVKLRAGDPAPKFALRMLDDQNKRVKLASFRKNKPVVLFFGSYT